MAVAAASAAAQQPAQPPPPTPPAEQASDQPPPRFRTEANYVRVDMYPTKDGVPVQDLRAEELELLEDGERQTIEAFEHVVISPAGPQSLRTEASSVRGAEEMAANPRHRVFVFFLDLPHVGVEGSYYIKEPLIRLMDRILGPDDLVAVMTTEMSAAQVTFGRKTEVIADMLRDRWVWGRRHSIVPMDAHEIEYTRCFPSKAQEGVVRQMIDRRRERMALDALHDLVRYLSFREERKAIVTVTDGWLLYRPDASLMALRVVDPTTGATEPVPGNDPVGVDPVGKLRVGGARSREGYAADQTICDKERMYLASIDNREYFRDLFDLANRNNASFYPVDPRGLSAFDYPLGPQAPPSIMVDSIHLRARIQNSQTLALNTDGIAVVNSNDLDKGLRRIADDLTSYYLLGYYSSNKRLDGGYRRLTVKVKRPGVQVRARRGYRAATVEEVTASREAAAAPVPNSVKSAAAALATLGRIRPDARFRLHAIPVRDGAGGAITALWVAGEVQPPLQELSKGGTATIEVSGGAATTATAALKAGERSFLVKVPVQAATTTQIDVRARLAADGGPDAPLSDSVRVSAEQNSFQPLLYRRGPTTGNRVQPAADFVFSRTERLRLELPIAAEAAPGAGRLLDRNAQPLAVPVTVSDRTDADGQHWLTADATLSALGAGDYVVEVAYSSGGTEQRVLTAVRVGR